MTNNDSAKELLANSYGLSVRRIRATIQGTLTIRNSRKPIPPSFPGEIVGLCGQGGKHPYFRIPLSVLEAALDRIAGALSGASSVERQMEDITAACQDLRQQTYFDTGTGCVNDRLPAMVPLLPPEEIWLDGRELPIDVWRLVCFEFDLVSSSVASQVSVQDFAFSAVTQSALAFRFLINQLGNRRVNFEVELNKIPGTWISPKAQRRIMDVSLARVFYEAGSLLTPLADQDFIKWYGAIRYLHWIDGGLSDLRVRDEFDRDSVDCRYRGLFAEEIAIGLMAIVLSDLFGASPINNTVEVLPLTSIARGQPIADFIASAKNPTTSMKTTIIAESKGSLGNKVSKGRFVHAKDQLAATNVLVRGTGVTLPLVFGSTIRFSRQKLKSQCFVTDPPADGESEPMYVNPRDAWRVAYAKALKFVGLETAAQQVLRGDPAEAIRPIDFDRQRDRSRSDRDFQRLRRANSARERFGVDLFLDAGSYAVGLDTDVAAILRHGIDGESQFKIDEILSSRRQLASERFHGVSFETSLGFGCIAYSDLDEEGDRDRVPEI
jgi:hypothetical protein